MRRRTKPKVVWLPQTNSNSVDTAARSTWGLASVALNATGGQAASTVEVPLVIDGNPTTDPLATNASLSSVESSGYRLRRIVGKIFVFLGQTERVNEDIYGVTVGFIVRRVDPNTGVSLASTAVATEIDVGDIDNTMDPWIWRRSWILSNGPTFVGGGVGPVAPQQLAQQIGRGAGTNFAGNFGGAVGGPHIDQKTARVIGPEERLFMDCSGIPIIAGGTACSLVVIYELRFLASMRTAIGNRRNASR